MRRCILQRCQDDSIACISKEMGGIGVYWLGSLCAFWNLASVEMQHSQVGLGVVGSNAPRPVSLFLTLNLGLGRAGAEAGSTTCFDGEISSVRQPPVRLGIV